MTARRAASLVSLAALTLVLTACDAETSDKPDSSSSPAPSAKPSQPTNRYNPQLLLTQDDLQALVPGSKLSGYKCAPYNNDNSSFRTNALACTSHGKDAVRAIVATTVETGYVDESLRNSDLTDLSDVMSHRGSVAISARNVKGSKRIEVFVDFSSYREANKPFPTETDVKIADRILVKYDIPSSKGELSVNLLIGTPNHEVPLDRLIKAANIAGANLQKEFKQ